MEEKKIATSLDILINVDRFEHFQITKYAEKKITYETKEEMIQKEDQLTIELLSDIHRSLKLSVENLGGISREIAKKMDPVSKIEEKIGKKIPAWLEDGYEPNIANKAKENSDKSIDKSNASNAEEEAKKVETTEFLEGNTKKIEPLKKEIKKEDISSDKDLFSEDEELFK